MKTDKKVSIKIGSQDSEENVKNTRRTLRDLQKTATDKENLVGRSDIKKDPKSFSADRSDHRLKKQKVLMQNKSVQVGECVITTKDLTSDEPSADYWKKLAETRGEALNRSLEENEKLKENVTSLQQENRICKEMLEESRHLVEVLKEMLEEKDEDDGEKDEDDGECENKDD